MNRHGNNRHIVLKAGMILVAILVVSFMAIDLVIFPLPHENLKRAQAHFIYDRNGNLLNMFASADSYWRMPVGLEEISPFLIKSVIAVEDRWFWIHPGVNPLALFSAALENIKAGRTVRGGSTITMQIARMMEPKARNITGKIRELFRALQLELHYSKEELLEMYFNLVPYGGNIEGVGAAAYFYFNKSPANLTIAEAALLSAIPASPNNYRPDVNPGQCKNKRDIILAALLKQNIIKKSEYQDALREEIPGSRISKPFIAPHFCLTAINGHPLLSRIKSTLDVEIQILCQRVAADFDRPLKERGIHNLSIVVIDNQSGELLAMVGSADFSDWEHQGQINGAYAPRSPGSALKPFAYALGLEEGIITPQTVLEDIPISYNGYSPVNYDKQFLGLVSVREALIKSLNIPAVNLTAAAGLNNFFGLLKKGGISTLNRKADEYGLPLVLGACEVNLADLCNLYATLGRQGVYKPLRFVLEEGEKPGQRILSAEACYLISEILCDLNREDLPQVWRATANLPQIAWKTGTSYGRRDAWAIGYNPQYTVGVWSGNFAGQGGPGIVGVEASAPIMFAIFNEIGKGPGHKWFSIPPGLGWRKICTRSGRPASQFCLETGDDFYIIGVSDNTACTVHQPLLIDKKTGYALCRACVHSQTIDTVIVENWPVKCAFWLRSHGIASPLPGHNPLCSGSFAQSPPAIISPEQGSHFEIRNSVPLEFQQILFKAGAGLECGKIHWFLDNELYATCPPDREIFYRPVKGQHILMCVDDLGRSSSIEFSIH